MQSVEAGYSGDAHRTSITLAAERALSGCAAVRTRLVPSPRAQDPRSYPVLIDSSTAGEGARALLSERDLRLSLSLVEAAASVTDAVVQSYRAINGATPSSVLLTARNRLVLPAAFDLVWALRRLAKALPMSYPKLCKYHDQVHGFYTV